MLDAGIIIDFVDILTLGISINNLKVISEYDLLTNVRVGINKRIIVSDMQEVLISADAYLGAGEGWKFSGGLEYGLVQTVFIRVGYEYDPDLILPTGSISGITGGFGIKTRAFIID